MSADAKVWPEDDDGRFWGGIHDGECSDPLKHQACALLEQLESIDRCFGQAVRRWETRLYPDGKIGLRGFTA